MLHIKPRSPSVATSFRSAFIVLLLAGGAGICGCSIRSGSGTSSTGTQRLILTGSSTVAPLMLEVAKRFESLNPNVRIDVQTGGSSRGIADARRGLADIGMVSRDAREDERDLQWHPLANDGIGIIVHKDNSLDAIEREQVVEIYTRSIRAWSDLQSNREPSATSREADLGSITVVNKAAGRSTLELFLGFFDLTAQEVDADVIIGDNEQGIKTVAGNPTAIGYVSIGTAAYDASIGVPIKLLSIDGVDATVANVQAGEYPLSRRLNLVTVGELSPLQTKFIRFAQSETNSDLIQAQYFVPIDR